LIDPPSAVPRGSPAAEPPGAAVEGFRVTRRFLAGSVALGVGAAALLGGTSWGKEQLALSFTRIPDSSVELFFTDPQHPCGSGRRDLEFTTVNHYRTARSFEYSVRVTSGGPGGPVHTSRGRVRLEHEAGRPTRVGLPASTGRQYVVEVSLTGLPQRIVLTCGRGAGR
jgi:hypothetical protein